MGRLSGRSSAAIVLVLSCAASLAQATDPAPPTATLQVQSQLVLVPTTVSTAKAGVLYGLTAEQFLLEDNGVRQRVRLDASEDDARPLSLVVAVQCSRSAEMEFEKLRGLNTMVDALTGAAPAEVAVVQFGTGEELLTGFTRNPQLRNAALNKIAPCDYDNGNTIFDAIDYANTLFESHHAQGRRAILLISETRDHGSQMKPDVVIKELGRSNIVLDAVAFSPARDEMVDSLKEGGGSGIFGLLLAAVQAVRKNAPKEFAALSGGEYINFGSQKDFDRGMTTLANHVHNFYLLSFVPSFPPDATGSNIAAPGLHKITVKVPLYPDATVRHRESYWNGPEGSAPAAAQ